MTREGKELRNRKNLGEHSTGLERQLYRERIGRGRFPFADYLKYVRERQLTLRRQHDPSATWLDGWSLSRVRALRASGLRTWAHAPIGATS